MSGRTGTHPAPGGRAVLLDDVIGEYLHHLMVERGLSANTIAAYRRDLRRYQGFCESRGLQDPAAITGSDLNAYLGTLRAGTADHPPLAESSAGRAIVAVRGLHAFMLNEGHVDADVAHGTAPPRPPQRLPEAISVAEVTRVVESPSPDSATGLRDRAVLELLYGSGCRAGELVGLDLPDLDVVGRQVRLTGKGNKQRVVPIGRAAAAALDAYLVRVRPEFSARTARPGQAVFLNTRGGRLTRQSVWNILRRAGEQIGRPDLHPHTLRHSFATHLMQAGADVRVVQELLGHASVTTTQIYTLVTIDQLREVYATTHPRGR